LNEFLLVVVMAAVWWGPTFICLSDLQRRRGVRRVLVWKWMALLCVPVGGALFYWTKGKKELEEDAR
jgi:hypothetical protein